MTNDAYDAWLADATAPGHADELTGLAAAVSWFEDVTPARPRRKLGFLGSRLVAPFVSAVAVGGIALAAATNSLPSSAQRLAHTTLGAPAPPAEDHVKPTASAHGSSEATDSATPGGTPSPSLLGLCRAYAAGQKTDHGKALDNPAFAYLISKAGGRANVPAYCATVLANAPGSRPSPHPTPHATPHATHKPAPPRQATNNGR